MDVVLLDTTIASVLHPKKAKAPERALYAPHMQNKVLALSFQTVAELLFWAEENRWGVSQRTALDAFIGKFLIIPYDNQLARSWAIVMTQAKAAGSGGCLDSGNRS